MEPIVEMGELGRPLYELQRRLTEKDVAGVILLESDRRLLKWGAAQLLSHWLERRKIVLHHLKPELADERNPTFFHRFWASVPPKGQIAVITDSWYTDLVFRSLDAKGDDVPPHLDIATIDIATIALFEQLLEDEGVSLLKVKLSGRHHIGELASTLAGIPEHPADPDFKQWGWTGKKKHFRKLLEKIEDTGSNNWQEIAAGTKKTSTKKRALSVAKDLADQTHDWLAKLASDSPPRKTPKDLLADSNVPRPARLPQIDLSASLDKPRYKELLLKYQQRLAQLSAKACRAKMPWVVLFEGWDAAGKGGAIRRMVAALDTEIYQVVPISAPTEDELRYPYLWRFWQHLPQNGHLTIFDRSWYGRVLVERVEKLAPEPVWRRAYGEINGFEQALSQQGVLVLKFWLHIDQETQLERFEAREKDPSKKHKITEEDWRNRKKWDEYENAVEDMLALTDTGINNWRVIAANDKRLARVEVLQQVCAALEKRLLAEG